MHTFWKGNMRLGGATSKLIRNKKPYRRCLNCSKCLNPTMDGVHKPWKGYNLTPQMT